MVINNIFWDYPLENLQEFCIVLRLWVFSQQIIRNKTEFDSYKYHTC